MFHFSPQIILLPYQGGKLKDKHWGFPNDWLSQDTLQWNSATSPTPSAHSIKSSLNERPTRITRHLRKFSKIRLKYANRKLQLGKTRAVRNKLQIKGIQIGKEVKLLLFADDIENPKDATRKPLEFINEFSKPVGCKINTQKSIAFLYTNNERTERSIKEIIPFTITTMVFRSTPT